MVSYMSRANILLAGVVTFATLGMLWGFINGMHDAKTKPVDADQAEPSKEELYEQKYLAEFKELAEPAADVDITELEVAEDTPDGKVIMRHNGAVGSFKYWADKKTVKFAYLDTVARVFCVTHDCKPQYITGEIGAPCEGGSQTSCDGREEVADDSIFAAFKPYSRGRPSGPAAQKISRNQFKYAGMVSDARGQNEDGATSPVKDEKSSIEYKEWAASGVGEEK